MYKIPLTAREEMKYINKVVFRNKSIPIVRNVGKGFENRIPYCLNVMVANFEQKL